MPSCWLSGRVMQWLSSRPPGRSRSLQEREVRRVVLAPRCARSGRSRRPRRSRPRARRGSRMNRTSARSVSPSRSIASCAQVGLLAGQRHAERLDAVVLRRVPDHAAPAAADVEQPHARLEAELAGDQVVLVGLRLLQRRVRVRVDRRRCRSSTGRAPTRRTCSRRRSGGGSPRRRGSCECRSPCTARRHCGGTSCGGGCGGRSDAETDVAHQLTAALTLGLGSETWSSRALRTS